jgi:hypothetical protein
MSFSSPAFTIARQAVGPNGPVTNLAQAEFVKMFDPPTENPITPELIDVTALPIFPFAYNALTHTITPNPRANPVAEIMQALGLGSPSTPHTRTLDLLNALAPPNDVLGLPTWDGAKFLTFFTIRDKDFTPAGGTYPGPTIRIPRGSIHHGDLRGKGPPPHTIHWHGIEPTPINDGVGHASMEIGAYLYQWQANFIGTYFYHCHRNTMQHFEFGLFGLLIVDPPDAYFSSIASVNGNGTVNLNGIPVGASSDGRFRTAANILTLPADVQAKFAAGFVAGDPTYGVAGPGDVGVNHPHAFTAAYDVEALWVADDRDSRWSDLASGARDTFPAHGSIPGTNDNFKNNIPGGSNFFAFNDYHADYWFVTGVPVPAHLGETGTINPGAAPPLGGIGGVNVGPTGLIPPAANSGKSGSQIAVNATVGQTILLRCLDAAYNNIRVTLPVDAVIIAWDGRPLGVPPFGSYNHAFVVPKNTPMTLSVARRFDALIKAEAPINTVAKIEFLETRGGTVTATALVPFTIV